MTIKRNSAAGGTDELSATTVNTGGVSGHAPSVISKNGGDILFDTASAAHDTLSYRIAQLASVVTEMRWDLDAADPQAMVSFHFRTPGAFSVSSSILQIRHAAGSMASIQFTTSSKLRVNNAAGTQVHLTTASLSANTWYRVELRVVKGSTTANGVIEFAFYALSSASPVEAGFSSAAQNTGTADATNVRLGRTSAATADTTAVWLDSIQILSGADAAALVVDWPAPLTGGSGELVWTGAAWE